MRQRTNRPNRQYATIPNSVMRDSSVSMEARGMLALLMTYSDTWTFRRDKLMEISGFGKDKFGRVMRELRDAGYVILEHNRDEAGRLHGSEWIICDEPNNREPENPELGDDDAETGQNRDRSNPASGEPAPIRRTNLKNTNMEEIAPNGADSLFSAMEDDQPSGTTDGSSQSAEKQEDPFETFWREFPPGRKTDKPKARKLFWAIVKGTNKTLTKATAVQLIDGAKRFARSEPDPQFTPMPTTWLNGERWTAEPEPQRKAVSSGYGGGHRYRPPTGEVVR